VATKTCSTVNSAVCWRPCNSQM